MNHTIFGFNSGAHDTLNGTSVQMYGVLIMDNSTIWFYDPVTCKDGGVGAININETTEQTLDGARVSLPLSLPVSAPTHVPPVFGRIHLSTYPDGWNASILRRC